MSIVCYPVSDASDLLHDTCWPCKFRLGPCFCFYMQQEYPPKASKEHKTKSSNTQKSTLSPFTQQIARFPHTAKYSLPSHTAAVHALLSAVCHFLVNKHVVCRLLYAVCGLLSFCILLSAVFCILYSVFPSSSPPLQNRTQPRRSHLSTTREGETHSLGL
jgi:hypothetical protein